MYQVIVFCGYLTFGSMLGMSILFCCDKEKFFNISERLSWESVKCYHKVNNKIKRVLEDLKPMEIKNHKITKGGNISKKKSKNIYKFIGYHNNNTFMCNINKLKANQYFIDNTDFDIMFIKQCHNEEILWKRILNKSELEKMEELTKFEKIDKPFLQIEYYQEKDESLQVKTEIHTNMKNFYIKNNKILDKTFVEWYIREYFSCIHCENYELQIIDTNINIFKMTNNDFCLLKPIDDHEYIIKHEN